MAFAEKMKSILNKGVAEAKDLSARGVLKLENMQLQARKEKLAARLGNEVSMALQDRTRASVGRDDPLIRDILKEIEGVRVEIDLKEEEYHSIGGTKK